MRAFSDDLRLRIHEACQAGESTAVVAERFEVSPAFVRRLQQRFRESGSLAPRPGGRGPAPKLAAHEAALRQAVHDHSDATPAEHRAVETPRRARHRLANPPPSPLDPQEEVDPCVGTGAA